MILKKIELFAKFLWQSTVHFNKKSFSKKIENKFSQGILIYADVNLNIIDGSSLWLINVLQLLVEHQSNTPKILLLKFNVNRKTLISSLKNEVNLLIIEPKDLYHVNNSLTVEQAVDAISYLDDVVGGFSSIILRGFELCKVAASRNNLSKRLVYYFTELYKVNKDQLIFREHLENDLINIGYTARGILVQTSEINDLLQDQLKSAVKPPIRYCPPILPDTISDYKTRIRNDNHINLVYAGKLAPQWGILELFETFHRLKKEFDNVYLHIIGNKIHNSSAEFPYFKETVLKQLLTTSHLIWHKAKSREETLTLLQNMDIAWAYRDIFFENHTKEISCKLLEYFSIVPITIATRSPIITKTVGESYTYLVPSQDDLYQVTKSAVINTQIKNLPTSSFNKEEFLAKTIYENNLKSLLIKNGNNSKKKILVAGHDFKFINHFISHLRNEGFLVKLDHWSHSAAKDLNNSIKLLEWADIIFCEWCLGNAVWYSKNKLPHQRLFVRFHLQEVTEPTIKYPKQMLLDNVDKIIFVSEGIKQKAKSLCGWGDERLMTIPNYVETDRFAIPKEVNHEFTLGIVGVVPQRKRLDRAIDLLEALRKEDDRFKLRIKGKLPADYPWMHAPSRSNELKYYQDLYDRINKTKSLKEAIRFDGFDANMAAWYRSIAYVLSPSDFESFHYSIADGVSSGAFPIIWPWDDAVNIYKNDWIIQDTKEAVAQIKKLSQLNNQEKNQLLENNRKFIVDRYSSEVIYDQLKNLILMD